jgi:hypothetical protein
VADDRGVAEQPLDVPLAEPRDLGEVEAGERAPEAFPLAQDRQPGEAGLEAFEAELLEQPPVVGDGEAPLGVVVGAVLRRRVAPEAADDAVLATGESIIAQSSAPFRVSQVMISTDIRPARTDGSPFSISRSVSSRLVR